LIFCCFIFCHTQFVKAQCIRGGNIDGPRYACPGDIVTYLPDPNCSGTGAGGCGWEVNGGQFVDENGNNLGTLIYNIDGFGTTARDPVRVRWNSSGGPASIRMEFYCDLFVACKTVNINLGLQNPSPITGPYSVCNGTTATYSIDPVPGATYYRWEKPSYMSIQSGQGTRNLTVRANSTLSGNICVTAERGSNCESIKVCKNVTSSHSVSVGGPSCVYNGESFTLYANVSPNAPSGSTYNWYVEPPFVIETNYGSSIIVRAPYSGNINTSYFSVTVNSSCGVFSGSKLINGCGSYALQTYPNPAESEVTLERDDEKPIGEVVLINKNQKTVKSWKIKASKTKINVSDVPPGEYFLKYNGKKKEETKRIIIE